MKDWLRVGAALLVAVGAAPRARAHCDALDGPVVKDARLALESGRVAVVLKWIAPEKESELREAFRQALVVRGPGGEARALADRYFFETLVRIHREGEGAPFTGLKPAGQVDPAIAAADQALASGSVEALARRIAGEAERGLRERFERAVASRRRSDENVELGRQAVAAYVEYVHYAERLLAAARTAPAHHDHGGVHPQP
jgi:hypothetical protein